MIKIKDIIKQLANKLPPIESRLITLLYNKNVNKYYQIDDIIEKYLNEFVYIQFKLENDLKNNL